MESTAIQIDFNGFLSRERTGRMKFCFCPTASPNMTIKCGDWCPFFGEPVISNLDASTGRLTLSCQSKLTFEGMIIDNRERSACTEPTKADIQVFPEAVQPEPITRKSARTVLFPEVITIGK